ncbi:hypothetical protein [Streptomyces erythrochromogenes]|uniref:hypothetical protein n=1 Tax=Streptomyces erythrochromogenes TaxID=285574 RepID=UPI002258E711|nr:hypothetical protein [Streptomyces erythrochromogenes]MCX5584278.1 hypothetical protein [Streptomyces erythrochromogenes]
MPIKRCKASFSVSVNGVPRVITAGTLLDASDPVIKGRETLFEDVDTYMSERAPQPVERATAEPGERRSLGGRKPGRKPAASEQAPQGATKEEGAS